MAGELTELTTTFAGSVAMNDVLRVGNQTLIVDWISGNTIRTRRPILGHYIAWFFLGLWHSLVESVSS